MQMNAYYAVKRTRRYVKLIGNRNYRVSVVTRWAHLPGELVYPVRLECAIGCSDYRVFVRTGLGRKPGYCSNPMNAVTR